MLSLDGHPRNCDATPLPLVGLRRNILYHSTLLGRLNERTGKITGATFRSEKC
jgi:hypothetical protein